MQPLMSMRRRQVGVKPMSQTAPNKTSWGQFSGMYGQATTPPPALPGQKAAALPTTPAVAPPDTSIPYTQPPARPNWPSPPEISRQWPGASGPPVAQPEAPQYVQPAAPAASPGAPRPRYYDSPLMSRRGYDVRLR